MLFIALNNTDDTSLGRLPVIERLFSLLVIEISRRKKNTQNFAAFV